MGDVLILGGGLIGLSCALELKELGASVTVVDEDRPGQASWAAAGILAPQSEVSEPSPMLDLCRKSFALYPEFVGKLGADVGFRRNGTLHRAFTGQEAEKIRAHVRWQHEARLRVEELRDGWFFPDEGQVDNRKLLTALRAACDRAGVRVEKKNFFSSSGPVVHCTGAWTAGVRPVKGQMIAIDAAPPPQVVFGGGGYIVPRGDLTLVGATAEEAGFDPAPTEEGKAYLLEVARKHGYRDPKVRDHWAGFRPATRDGLPLIGLAGERKIFATGHFRNGVLLAPITARIVAALVEGRTPPLDLAPFDPLRYGP